MNTIDIRKIGITDLAADAIVNAANEGLWAGGGVCGYIFAAAGHDQLQKTCDAIGHCDTGSAVITPAFNLKAKYIIHAVGPVWNGGDHHEPQLLYGAYKKSLELAQENNCHSIAFPLLSSGIFGYPKDKAWRKAIQACNDFFQKHPDADLHVIFAVLDDVTLAMGQKTIDEIVTDDDSAGRNVGVSMDTLKIESHDVKAIFFHLPEEPNGYLSNWYPAKFTEDGISFTSSEQYIMYRKCLIFGDKVLAAAILATNDTAAQQDIGRNASGFVGTVWDGMKQVIAFHGLMAKFSQNADLKKKLLDTGDAYLVECAYKDTVWACGRRLVDDEKNDMSHWRGQNLLGFALMEVRAALLEEQKKLQHNIVIAMFVDKPERMGLRGDHYFWDYLANVFRNTDEAIDPNGIEHIVRQEFEKVSGHQLTKEERPYVEQFAHGGMSSGLLSGLYWVESGIPLLQERFSQLSAEMK